MTAIPRRKTHEIMVGNVGIGGNHPIVIQSMTNTPTADVALTVAQIVQLVQAGSEIVRITVNDEQAARAIVNIRDMLTDQGVSVPLVGDFHFNGHLLLTAFPEMAKALDKYRINPGNIGQGQLHDQHFEAFVHIAKEYHKPIRIGVNSGSLDPELLSQKIKHENNPDDPTRICEIIQEAMVESALVSAQTALKLGLGQDQIIISAKMSDLSDMVSVYRMLAQRCSFPLHVGLTEAGGGLQGIVSSTAALSILLKEGIGDTIRVSLTPDLNTPRTTEIEICQHILQSLGIRYFSPKVISCPGCGRTSSSQFLTLASEIKKYIMQHTPRWKKTHPDVANLTIAVMGCVVNGPGESKHADIGISLPGDQEAPAAPVYIHGKKVAVLTGKDLAEQFFQILDHFINTIQ
ncbi:MAG TPA: flavodoxin-dependent (E)-4-hydroxy-3-methylbut-2-enyl-diphosphate synthase [Candidatus Bathyarchaeia archaeon]|nr:flavodoxin-dependent (E)-4-hydroxy-3-methylbut-2-enyl-diphosphate synthase [Candidatus Bathyarchaeia archaeon]